MKNKSKNAGTLLKELMEDRKDPLPACLAIIAPDRVRRERAVKYIEDRLNKEGITGRSFTYGESSKDTLSAFLQELAEPSLFEPSRLGFVRNIGKAKVAELEPLSKFISKQLPKTTLVVSGESLPNSQGFRKVVETHGVLVNFDALKGAELRRWTEREFRQNGVDVVQDEVVENILALAAEAPEEVANLIEKYSLFLDGEAPSLTSLRQLFIESFHASDFELAESLLNSSREKNELLLHQLFAQGSSPFMLMGLLAKTWVTLLRIRSMMDKGVSPNDIRTHLGVSPWLFSKYTPLVKRVSSNALAQHVSAFMEADFRLKDRSLGPQNIFSQLAGDVAQRIA